MWSRDRIQFEEGSQRIALIGRVQIEKYTAYTSETAKQLTQWHYANGNTLRLFRTSNLNVTIMHA